MAESGHAIVDQIISRWSDAFTRIDADALSALYSQNTLFYGSVPTLFRGRAGVADYFNGLTRWPSPSVTFTDLVVVPIGDGLLNMAGRATFFRSNDVALLHVKITWIIQREPDGWRIISHHVSPIAPLIARD